MTLARRKEIASMGGKAAHKQGTAHEWTKTEAAAAGRKGGVNAWTVRNAAKKAAE